MTSLIIDRLGQLAERAPRSPLLPERQSQGWQHLTNARAWAESGAVASWLIAQGFGPGAATLSVAPGDTPEAAVLLLGALRAGALVVDRGAALALASRNGRLVVEAGRHAGLAAAALARCSVAASVAERRLHIDGNTPARLSSDKCVRQGDLATMAEAVTRDRDGRPDRQTVDAAR